MRIRNGMEKISIPDSEWKKFESGKLPLVRKYCNDQLRIQAASPALSVAPPDPTQVSQPKDTLFHYRLKDWEFTLTICYSESVPYMCVRNAWGFFSDPFKVADGGGGGIPGITDSWIQPNPLDYIFPYTYSTIAVFIIFWKEYIILAATFARQS